ncbi:rod shape-determining protein RodA [Nitrosococcus halophilus Nc 4]|uniref:Peptidoglycan glycosyltransferase MrdB n=1 Tax=Nitrosococcus halophilus (strain Nc4) TaxID=472759 RepID=D5BWA6_NITHN|nr:rod shape-determining protein RodA [Nitrosococcus halophilus]ADE13756.1 rod shape-determining protein RodA [Nitrosococcus halophilus Nc 4]
MAQARIEPPGWLERRRRPNSGLLYCLHLDSPLLLGLVLLSSFGLVVLFSAGGQDIDLIQRQLLRLGVALVALIGLAQVPPRQFERWAPWLYGLGLGLLIFVLVYGHVGKGAQRWLDFGIFRFQPSEIMKIAVPMMIAHFFAQAALPPRWWQLLLALVLIILPAGLIAKQPDLGTALLIAVAGLWVLFLAGVTWRLIMGFGGVVLALVPVLWYQMHDYQQQRVLTFLNPENDPLGAGYHMIQSKIAIGSGGLYGKGWLNGSQAHLDFLPEQSTDFIFAVIGEEFGLVGAALIVLLYWLLAARGLYIAFQAQDSFSRLLAGSLSLTFFIYVFVNVGMVTGLLPVVGVPLPLISYGGTSMVTLFSAFGILMSIHTHRRLIPR